MLLEIRNKARFRGAGRDMRVVPSSYTRAMHRRVYATGVCEKNTPSAQALALQSSSRNGPSVPDLVL